MLAFKVLLVRPLLFSSFTGAFVESFITAAPRPSRLLALQASSDATTTTTTTFPTTTPSTLQDPVILFDGVCNFCNTWVDLLLRIDLNKRFKFAPLQSDIGQSLLVKIGKESDDISSVVLVEPTPGNEWNSYDKSACVLQVVQTLGWPARVAARSAEAILPEELRDGIYDVVAENRYKLMGKREECRCGDPKYADRFLA